MDKRVLTSLLLLAIGLPALLFGGVPFFIFLGFFIVMAAKEYTRMMRALQLEPSTWITVGGVFLILLTRFFFLDFASGSFTLLLLIALGFHTIAYERGREKATLDFLATAGGLAYLGWVGAYLLDLRNLPDGGWWLFIVLPSIFMADSGAYSIGAAYGRRKMAPRLSPNKTWEGYWAGVFTGALFGGFFAFAYSTWGPLEISIVQGATLGLVLSLITPLGDLGESLFKRPAGIKDSGSFLPGHGGAFDRIDSWLWAAVIGYYYIKWFLI
ncbi:MAG: phosphatidate cytidylyltransferase [Anaerolineae bacterium]|nr:phosphatidate cytidylyltransferase [Anaerolineae bacterium]